MKAASFSSLEETQFDKTATMKILLEHGANVNTKNELGKITLLMSQYLFYIFISKFQNCTLNNEIDFNHIYIFIRGDQSHEGTSL